NDDICVMDADGTDIVNLTNTVEAFENWPSWGPAPRHLEDDDGDDEDRDDDDGADKDRGKKHRGKKHRDAPDRGHKGRGHKERDHKGRGKGRDH
ncbi:MAG TPA: hypothetical protein VFB51_04230, partial [Solirubrobacterales bacterium]|nr:hypothetical protein [Solirubrobacterales bacterium]